MADATKTLDASGLACPMPIVKTRRPSTSSSPARC
jgi:TusA-related sulfurtransferase